MRFAAIAIAGLVAAQAGPSDVPVVAKLPSAPNGMTLKACMAVWDPSTDMTKAQWRRTCEWQLKEDTAPL
jgi:hypothetical protein